MDSLGAAQADNMQTNVCASLDKVVDRYVGTSVARIGSGFPPGSNSRLGNPGPML